MARSCTHPCPARKSRGGPCRNCSKPNSKCHVHMTSAEAKAAHEGVLVGHLEKLEQRAVHNARVMRSKAYLAKHHSQSEVLQRFDKHPGVRQMSIIRAANGEKMRQIRRFYIEREMAPHIEKAAIQRMRKINGGVFLGIPYEPPTEASMLRLYPDATRPLRLQWLDGNIIDAYLGVLQRSFKSKMLFDTTFALRRGEATKHLMYRGIFKDGRQWKGIHRCLIPVNPNGQHWVLYDCAPDGGDIYFYDSYAPGGNHGVPDPAMVAFIRMTFNTSNRVVRSIPVPLQENAKDCGIYVLALAEHLGKYGKILPAQIDPVAHRARFHKILRSQRNVQ